MSDRSICAAAWRMSGSPEKRRSTSKPSRGSVTAVALASFISFDCSTDPRNAFPAPDPHDVADRAGHRGRVGDLGLLGDELAIARDFGRAERGWYRRASTAKSSISARMSPRSSRSLTRGFQRLAPRLGPPSGDADSACCPIVPPLLWRPRGGWRREF